MNRAILGIDAASSAKRLGGFTGTTTIGTGTEVATAVLAASAEVRVILGVYADSIAIGITGGTDTEAVAAGLRRRVATGVTISAKAAVRKRVHTAVSALGFTARAIKDALPGRAYLIGCAGQSAAVAMRGICVEVYAAVCTEIAAFQADQTTGPGGADRLRPGGSGTFQITAAAVIGVTVKINTIFPTGFKAGEAFKPTGSIDTGRRALGGALAGGFAVAAEVGVILQIDATIATEGEPAGASDHAALSGTIRATIGRIKALRIAEGIFCITVSVIIFTVIITVLVALPTFNRAGDPIIVKIAGTEREEEEKKKEENTTHE